MRGYSVGNGLDLQLDSMDGEALYEALGREINDADDPLTEEHMTALESLRTLLTLWMHGQLPGETESHVFGKQEKRSDTGWPGDVANPQRTVLTRDNGPYDDNQPTTASHVVTAPPEISPEKQAAFDAWHKEHPDGWHGPEFAGRPWQVAREF